MIKLGIFVNLDIERIGYPKLVYMAIEVVTGSRLSLKCRVMLCREEP